MPAEIPSVDSHNKVKDNEYKHCSDVRQYGNTVSDERT